MSEIKLRKGEVEIKYLGEDKMFLHKQIGEGKLPDGRRCRIIMHDGGIVMQAYSKNGKGWKSYSISWMSLSKAIADTIPDFEKVKS